MVKHMHNARILLLLLLVCCLEGCSKPEKSPVEATAEKQQSVAASRPDQAQDSGGEPFKNTPPRITALQLETDKVRCGVDIRIIPEAEDANSDLVQFRYRWFINDSEIAHDLDTLAGDQFRKGDRVSVRVQPFDAESAGPIFCSEEIVIPNAPPRFVSTPPTRFRAALYTYRASAEDPDNEPLTYSLVQGPAGMEINSSTGQVSWNIRQEDAGLHPVIIEVQDQDGMKARQEWQLEISIE